MSSELVYDSSRSSPWQRGVETTHAHAASKQLLRTKGVGNSVVDANLDRAGCRNELMHTRSAYDMADSMQVAQ